MRDSIVNFGENLPQEELTRGEHEGEVADLCLAMGSSLTVTPAADIPEVIFIETYVLCTFRTSCIDLH